MVIVRLCDMGCISNTLPVVDKLISLNLEPRIYIDPGSIAEERVGDHSLRISKIPMESTVLSCLPLGHSFEELARNHNPVVLIQENPDTGDYRFKSWVSGSVNLNAVCTLVRPTGFNEIPFRVTGLPSIEDAAQQMRRLEQAVVCDKIGLSSTDAVILLALPGDLNGGLRMLDLVSVAIDGGCFRVLARSHPKLQRVDPTGYKKIKHYVDGLTFLPLEEANQILSPFEAMCLSIGANNHFVGTHDTTMNWQAAASGVTNIHILPPAEDSADWESNAPIITSSLGRVFDGQLLVHHPDSSLNVQGSVDNIAEVVRSHLQ